MRRIAELLAHLDGLDIELWADGDRLRYNAPKGALTRALRSELRARKAELVAYLHEERDQIEQIPRVSRDGTLPLSFSQQRLWFLAQLEGESNAYNIYGAFRLNGPLDVAAFGASWQQIEARHEALRTTFPIVDGQARQQIHPPSFDPSTRFASGHGLELIDLSDLPTSEQEAEVARLAHQAANQTFDLINGPLWRVCLLRLGSQEHVLLFTIHHIISDGWSIGILMREFSTLYHSNTHKNTRSNPRSNDFSRSGPFGTTEVVTTGHGLPELPIQYADFAVWQREWLSGEVLQAQLEYWKAQLADAPPLLTLPTDHSRPAVQRYQGDHLSVTLPQSLHAELVGLSRQNRTTLFMTLQAAFAVLLSRYAGQEEILIGTPIANRQVADVKNLVGFFVNTLVLRNDLSASEQNPLTGTPARLTFRDVLARTRQTALEAYQHQALPFELLVETLQPERSLSHSPLFQVMFILENKRQEMLSLENVMVTPIEVEYSVAKFDLTLVMQEREQGLVAWWEYNTDLFERATIERMAGHFQILLEGIVANPDQSIAHLPLLTEREKHQLLVEWNATDADYPSECIHQLFEQQVKRTPEAIALVFGDQALTYHELNRRANQLAHTLIAQGVGPDVLVGICTPRSVEMVVGLLGILKAGGAYVPLDPNYPQERIQFMLDDANVQVLLTTSELLDALGHDAFTLCLDRPLPIATPAQRSREGHAVGEFISAGTNPNQNHLSTQLAYVLYTSGSTGRPKGVAIEHRSPVALFSWADTIFGPEELAGVLASTSICFDLSVFELFLPLTRGGKVILAENALALPSLQNVVLVNTVPSAMNALVKEGQIPNSVRVVNLAGEPLKNKLVQQVYAPHKNGDKATIEKVFNLYGPSEDTTYSTYALIEKGANSEPTIGRPISNTQTYILDAHLQPVPIGVPGELYLGGAGLARGYLNRPQLTSEKFILTGPACPLHGPACPLHAFVEGRLYKTGDLCRYLPDGNIEFLGRADYQVKIRGFRIELGEIETVLNQQANVREAVVVVHEDFSGSDKRLVAYVVIENGVVGEIKALRAQLSTVLPDYMIPSAFVPLEAMPLTPNGKINRRALPDPRTVRQAVPELVEGHRPDPEVEGPRTPTEEILAAIWLEVLGIEQVGIHDNFFEIGGHSLLATQVVSRIRQSLQVELPLRRLFSAPTIGELASDMSTERTLPPLKPLDHLARTALPLSFAQQRLWFLAQFEGTSDAYNIPAALRLAGPLDVAALSASWQVICQRHEALRTTFPPPPQNWGGLRGGGQARQQINPPSGSLELIDLSDLPLYDKTQEAEVMRLSRQEATRPFDLTNGPLWRVTLLRLSEEEHVLLMTMHHIISDGWSIRVLMRELSALYAHNARSNDRSNDFSRSGPFGTTEVVTTVLPELPVQYADFAVWQREWLSGDVLQAQLDYWKGQLADAPPLLTLPTDHPRPAVQSYRGDHLLFTLSGDLRQELKRLSQQNSTTLFMTLQAAFAVLLSRYAGQEEILIGTPIANRQVREIEDLIGFFVNTLVLRNDLSDNPSFRELLTRVRQVTLDAYQQQALPFELLVETLQPERSLSHSPLFQVMFSFENSSQELFSLADLTVTPIDIDYPISKFDLTLAMHDASHEAGLSGWWEYNSDLFERTTIERMATHFQTLLEGIVANPDQRIAHLPLLTEREKHQLLVEWNETKADYPSEKCIHELFEQQVERTPEAIAVVFGDQQLTYRDLNARANQLAHYLIAQGVGPDVLVGICVERSIEMVVGLLGILKAGGAYVPLDPNNPNERLQFMLDDAKVKVLLTEQKLAPKLRTLRQVDLDQDWWVGPDRSNPVTPVRADHLAYCIYTSGSTGRPKGVIVEHRHVQALLSGFEVIAPKNKKLIGTSLCPFGFDVSVWELFSTLCFGGTLHILSLDILADPKRLASYLATHQVTSLYIPPTLLSDLVTELEPLQNKIHLDRMLVGVEPIKQALLQRFRDLSDELRIINGYGPTESTVCATFFNFKSALEPNRRTPIGKPVTNYEVYLVDEYLQPVPIGVPGELHIGGAGVARGYLNRPQLTSEKFISTGHACPLHGHACPLHPFVEGRLYKTGDLCRYLPDGNIEFLGRADYQVKIRGFRIELGEIEAALNSQPNVREAVVVVRDEASGKRLVAYVVGEVPSRAQLSQRLPDYMIPSAFVLLSAMPLTPNGKINRRALPAPRTVRQAVPELVEGHRPDPELVEGPRTPTEEILAAIWQEVLGLEQVGIHNNFFEIGGHSLLAMQVVSRIRQTAQIELPLRRLFSAPTIAELASQLISAQSTLPPLVPVDQLPRPEPWPLSFGQQRLWFLQQLEAASDTYNISAALRLCGPLDVAAFSASCRVICERHEVLRTTFPQVDGQARQQINRPNFKLELIDLSNLPTYDKEGEVARLSRQEAKRPFDLETGPLWRVTLLRLGSQEHVLLLTMHHIISDGWSTAVLMRELSALYRNHRSKNRSNDPSTLRQAQGGPGSGHRFSRSGPPKTILPKLPVQYADFAVWQREWLTGDVLQRHLDYWKAQLADAPSLLTLPTDHARPAVQRYRGDEFSFTLPETVSNALKSLSQKSGTTLFMTLQAAFAVLLSRYSGQEDILIGTPIANRQVAEIEDLIGFFVNTLVLRNDLSDNPTGTPARLTFRDFLARVRQVTLDAYQQQALPFELLVETLQPERTLSHSPLFQVMFTLQNNPQDALSFADVKVSPIEGQSPAAKFDLTLTMQESSREEALIAWWKYNTDLFERATIERMATHFQTLLEGIVANPDQPIAHLPLLTERERHQLLVEWNDTATDDPQNQCIHQLFEQQAERTPDAVAVVFGDQQLTYHELNARANQLAHYLIAQGVGPDAPKGHDMLVAICAERSLEMMVGLLGILKAGGAYVPLDPNYPTERLAFMLSDAQVKLILTHSSTLRQAQGTASSETGALRERLSALSEASVLDLNSDELFGESQENPAVEVEPTNLAYVIYTSGSTGRPKGVMIAHQGLVNYLSWAVNAYPVREGSGIPVSGSFSFDGTIPTLFGPLLVGQRVILLPEENPIEALCHQLRHAPEQFSLVKGTPTHLQLLNDLLGRGALPSNVQTKALVLGGEALPSSLVSAWWAHAPESRVFNQYGPTEATVACSFYEVTAPRKRGEQTELTGTIPIGRPIPNTQLYILDRHLQPVPIGVPGELHIGGVGLARGYLNRPQLTKEKFIPNLFGEGQLYKTGDLCRYLPDSQGAGSGNIEFLGRTDHQVKIRGFRIELGEIEAVLNSLPGVRDAVVVVREEASSKRLVAYVVGEVPSRAQLSQKLPDYMIPHAFVSLEAMPLTPNGKINRRALPAPEYKVDETQLVWPRTPVESTLAAIWQEVLGLEQLGVTDNFFQVGGDSIISIQIVSRAREAGIHLTPKELFQHQTIAELASVARKVTQTQAEQGVVTGVLPLTPIQHRFFEQKWREPHHFNQSMLLELTENVNPIWLSEAVQALLTHHDALRLRFEDQGSSWRQEIIAPELDVPFEVIDLSAINPSEQALQLTKKANELQASLNLSQGPLVRVVLFESSTANRLLIIIHHLAVDGVSWRILLEDLQRAYQQLANGDAIELPAKTTSFKEWSTLLNETALGAQNEASALWAEREYWAQVTTARSRTAYVPSLPVDYAPCKHGDGRRLRDGLGTSTSSANDNASAAHISTRLSAAQTEALLNEVPAVYHTQINDLLLTALALAFQGWTGQSALLLELEGHGRESLTELREELFETDQSRSVDLSRTVGWFTSVFPVRLDLTTLVPELVEGQDTTRLGDAIKGVKEQLRRLPNRGIGYGILRYLHPKGMMSRSLSLSHGDASQSKGDLDMPDAKAEVSFNYLGQFDQMASGTLIKGFASESSGVPHSPDGERRYLLSVNGMVVEGQLQVDWTYSRNYHRAATIQQLANRFLDALQALIAHCQEPEAGGYTPSDFPEAQLNQEELDDLLSGLNAEQQNTQIEAIYPLSPMQQGMLFHSLYAPQSGVYFEQMAITLRGPLDPQAFRQAWQQVVARHAVLRTLFVGTQRQQPLQVVCQEVKLPWTEQDWRSLDDPEAQLASYLAAERAQGFELQRAPLMRCALMRVDDECYYFVRNHHHLLSDGWSTALLMKEVWAFYEAACRGEPLALPRARPYKAYIAWLQQQGMSRGTKDQAEAYWRQTLQGFTAPTPLVVDRVDYNAQQTLGNDQKAYSEHHVTLSSETTAVLQQMARESRLTLNTVIQGAWALLLARYSGEPEVLFGTTVSGRPAELSGVETMVGLFINTLPVRVKVPADAPVRPWLSTLQEQQREREQYAYSALVDIQGWSDVPRGTPLFESLLVYENYPVSEESWKVGAGLQITGGQAVEQTNYPLGLIAALIEKEEGPQLYLALNYHTNRFEDEMIERMAGHLQTLIAGVVANPDQPLAHLPLLTEREKHQLLVEWNETTTDYPSDKCIHQLFEEQVERTPEAIAVVFEDQAVTYRELNARANQLAHTLIAQGVGAEVLVGVCIPRSVETVVGLLGILKAGGAYVPLDPTAPEERLAYLLTDAQLSVLLTFETWLQKLPEQGAKLILMDRPFASITESNPKVDVRPNNLAYVIYTSGSTGKPKGVLVEHQGLCNSIVSDIRTFGMEPGARVPHVASFTFDAATSHLFMALCAGATVYLTSMDGELTNLLKDEAITHVIFPVSMLAALPYVELPQLKIVAVGADVCPPELVTRWGNGRRIFNIYGPTEATITTTIAECVADGQKPSIGHPIANVQVYILDDDLQPMPIGVPGELHIGGAGLARGYLNRPQLTAEKFIPNPFGEGRLYKTGDLARYLADGNIEFLGRLDYQVKIRGFRIELGEIEAQLSQHESVREVVVVVREETGTKRLVAYIIIEDGIVIEDDFVAQEPIIGSTLRAYLGQKLPDYMIPSAFVSLEAMPLTPNGKIDRRALPAPEASHLASSADFMAPRDQSEQQLVYIWQEVLDVHSVGIRDSFFDLGGHSLLAVRLMAQIQQHFGVNLPLATLFQYPTIEELATRLAQPKEASIEKAEWSALVPIQPNGDKLPFFCVPGGGGNVIYFYDLARFMGRSHPFYGLQAVGLDGETAPLTTVEAIAAHYVKVILSVQPEGPYLLGGHSFGGTVIFEMAQQLQRAGHEVARLMIFDTSAPPLPTENSTHTEPSKQASWDNAKWLIDVVEAVGTLTGQETALSDEHLLPLDPEQQLIRFKEELERLNYLPTNSDIKQVRGWVQVFKTNNLMTYLPRTVIPTPITLFRAAESESSDPNKQNTPRQDPAWGWNHFAKGPVEVISVPGNHTTMMTTPHIQVLAERLKESLRF